MPVEIGALGIALGRLGIELDLLVERGKRLIEIALVAIDHAPQQEVVALARIEPDGLVKVGDGLVVLLLGVVSGRPHEVGVGLGGVDLHRLVHLGDGGIEIADGGKRHGAHAVGLYDAVLVGGIGGKERRAGVEHLLDGAFRR